mmetsp:Transcript_15000/g.58738  ORF Transcript_15000/g.58738 Transcript_15000/m.58738 type:complete len:232 (-) Transcript_15000:64-759(-)
MQNEDLAVHERCERELHKGVLDHLEHRGIVPLQYLVLEMVLGVEARVLVVASVEEDCLRLLQLERIEQQEHLHAVRPAVHEVAVEQEHVLLRRPSSHLEDGEHIQELAMGIANDGEFAVLGNGEVDDGGELGQLLLHTNEDTAHKHGRQHVLRVVTALCVGGEKVHEGIDERLREGLIALHHGACVAVGHRVVRLRRARLHALRRELLLDELVQVAHLLLRLQRLELVVIV